MAPVKVYSNQPINSNTTKVRATPVNAFAFTNPFQAGTGFSDHRQVRNAPRPISSIPPGMALALAAAIKSPEQLISPFSLEPHDPNDHTEHSDHNERRSVSMSEAAQSDNAHSSSPSSCYSSRKSSMVVDEDDSVDTPRHSETYDLPEIMCTSPAMCGSPRSIPCPLHRDNTAYVYQEDLEEAYIQLKKQMDPDSGVAMNSSMKNPFDKKVTTQNEWSEFRFLEEDNDLLQDTQAEDEDEDEDLEDEAYEDQEVYEDQEMYQVVEEDPLFFVHQVA